MSASRGAPIPLEGWQVSTGISGSFQSESVATFAWNRWQVSTGISGNLRPEYALGRLFLLNKDTNITENDKPAVLTLIRDVVPSEESMGDITKLQKWYEDNKGRLIYDNREGRYRVCKED